MHLSARTEALFYFLRDRTVHGSGAVTACRTKAMLPLTCDVAPSPNTIESQLQLGGM